MEIEEKQLVYFHSLLDRFFDREATQEEVLQIQKTIQEKPGFKEYYFRYVELKAGLYQLKVHDEVYSSSVKQYDEILLELSEYEKNAPAIDLDIKSPEREIIQKVVYERQPHKISKFTIFSGIFSAAAILLVVLFIRFIPESYSIEVATLVDQINVKWADSKVNFKKGDSLWTNQEPLRLEKGIVKIQYDDGVDVLIEGPAKFTVERSGIYCEYGRLFGCVSESGLGFMIETPTSRFVDMGTEFGVQADVDGSSALHVIKGKVQLFAGPKKKTKSSRIVTENQAMRYNANNSLVKEIPIQKQIFVRSIDSRTNTVWRGEMQIDLADIVGGGNGLGTGILGSGIDAVSGVYTTTPTRVDFTQVQCQYNPVRNNPFIDGVFVPNGDEKPVILNSSGQSYTEFPLTKGIYRSPITNGPAIRDRQRFPSRSFKESMEFYLMELEMGGVLYGTPNDPAIYMHTNVGITFDLDAIRSAYGNHPITYFESICGIPEMVRRTYANETKNPEKTVLALYVFLDDQCRLVKTFNNNTSEPEKIRIPIQLKSRFLTFAVVDTGLNPDYDWCIFGRPVLTLE